MMCFERNSCSCPGFFKEEVRLCDDTHFAFRWTKKVDPDFVTIPLIIEGEWGIAIHIKQKMAGDRNLLSISMGLYPCSQRSLWRGLLRTRLCLQTMKSNMNNLGKYIPFTLLSGKWWSSTKWVISFRFQSISFSRYTTSLKSIELLPPEDSTPIHHYPKRSRVNPPTPKIQRPQYNTENKSFLLKYIVKNVLQSISFSRFTTTLNVLELPSPSPEDSTPPIQLRENFSSS